MDCSYLDLPHRPSKPRSYGITAVIDPGLPTGAFVDGIRSFAPLIDFVKLGWGTAVVTPDLEEKVAALAENQIPWCFGGTLYERHVIVDRLPEYVELCRRWGATHVEVSDGTVTIDPETRRRHIAALAEEFTVVSEVGYKDPERSAMLPPKMWVQLVRADLASGSTRVIVETRESGKGGICTAEGSLRQDVFEALVGSGVELSRLLFEAPTKPLQLAMLRSLGPNANLGNIALTDVVALETLREGLRGDTLLELTLPHTSSTTPARSA